MNQKTTSRTVARVCAGLSTSALVLLLGCAQQRESESSPALQPPPKIESTTITQVGFGDAAVFAACAQTDCPRPTPKTMLDGGATAPADANGLAAADGRDDEPARETAVGSWSESRMAETQVARAEPSRAEFVPVAQPPLIERERPAAVAAVDTIDEAPEAPQAAAPKRLALAAPRATAEPQSPASAVLASQLVVNFAVNSAQLSDEARAQLDSMRDQLLGAENIIVKGRTDNQGGVDANDRLALQRALAVHDYLTRLAGGQQIGRIHVMGTGDCCFVADNDTDEGRAANRRAEVNFVFPTAQNAAMAAPAQRVRNPS